MLLIPLQVIGSDDHDDDSDDDHDSGNSNSGRGRGDDVIPSGTVPAGSAEVRIDDDDADGFEPGTVTVDLGQSVTWVNLDHHDHTATGSRFDTGVMRPGEMKTVAFDEPGSYAYSCQIHPEMVGRVEVRDSSGRVPASPVASPQATPASASAGEVAVTIANLAFDPSNLDIRVGSTIVWTNLDQLPHTATATDGAFDSGTLDQGATFSHTFGTPGTHDYICAFHPNMRAVIRVSE
jgi:plastocyanin